MLRYYNIFSSDFWKRPFHFNHMRSASLSFTLPLHYILLCAYFLNILVFTNPQWPNPPETDVLLHQYFATTMTKSSRNRRSSSPISSQNRCSSSPIFHDLAQLSNSQVTATFYLNSRFDRYIESLIASIYFLYIYI